MKKVGVAIVTGVLAVSAVTGSAAAAKLITGKDIKNGSIHAVDLAASAKPKPGPRGPQGSRGPQGVPGPQGPVGSTAVALQMAKAEAHDVSYTDPYASVVSLRANCPAGYGPVSSGWGTTAEAGMVALTSTGAVGVFNNFGRYILADITLYVYCAPSSTISLMTAESATIGVSPAEVEIAVSQARAANRR